MDDTPPSAAPLTHPAPAVGRRTFAAAPMLAPALGLAVGGTAILLPAADAVPAAAAGAGLLLILLLGARWGGRPGRFGALAAVAGAGLALLHWTAPWQTLWPHLPRPACGAEIRAVLVDPACPGAAPADSATTAGGTPWLAGDAAPWAPPPAGLRAAVQAVRFAPDRPWQPVRGTVILRLPKEGLPGAAYGAAIVATGAFSEPAAALFPGDFDYRFFLRLNGIRGIFTAADGRVAAPCRGWRRLPAAALAVRDRAAAALTRGVADPGRARLLAALLFGTAQPLDPRDRGVFLRSGTIHVFSVSGLNVAILATLLLFLPRLGGVPYGWRHALLPLPLGFYVVMTGAEAPAVRAWVMLAVWALARSRLQPVAPLNTIAIAAAILLLANPLHLGQVGFQFSFLLVLFLMLGWRAAGRLAAAAAETDRWRPLECRRRDPVQAGQRWCWRSLGAGLAGWLAGAGLIAWHNQLLIPAGLPVNLMISATAWLALAGGLLKVAVGWLPGGGGADLLLARGLEGCIVAMRALAEWGAAAPASLPLPRPPAWSVVAYYAGLLVACRPWHGRRSWRAAGAGLAALCLGLWLAAPGQPRGPRLAMTWGEGGAPPAVALRHADGRTALWLPGGPARARRLANWLRINGIDEIETLLLPDARAESARTLETLAGAVTVRSAVVPANASGTVPGRLRDAAAAAGCGLRTDAASPPGPDGTARWCFDPAGLATELERARNRQAAGLRFAGGPGVTLRAAGSGNTLLAVQWPGGTGALPAWRHSRPGLRPHFEQLTPRP